jgi:outer membrane protein assembly factor BamB
VLYVSSANESAETLKYSQQAVRGGEPLTYKIDVKTGQIVWKAEKFDDCFVSGGSVYATRETRNAIDAVNGVFEGSKAIKSRFKLYKLSARDGRPQWEWFQTRRPLRIDADRRKVSLLFEGRAAGSELDRAVAR